MKEIVSSLCSSPLQNLHPRVVRQNGMDAENLVGNLGDTQIYNHTGKRESVGSCDFVLLNHEIKHGIESSLGGNVQAFVKAESQPASFGPRARRSNMHI